MAVSTAAVRSTTRHQVNLSPKDQHGKFRPHFPGHRGLSRPGWLQKRYQQHCPAGTGTAPRRPISTHSTRPANELPGRSRLVRRQRPADRPLTSDGHTTVWQAAADVKDDLLRYATLGSSLRGQASSFLLPCRRQQRRISLRRIPSFANRSRSTAISASSARVRRTHPILAPTRPEMQAL